MADFHEVVIVGGGIGGSALAAVLAEAGRDVLLLEQSDVFVDRVRGEWIAPWGVVETQRLGLFDTLKGAGGHHIGRHVTYDESRTPEEAEARTLPLSMFAADVPGPLAIGNPHHAQTLFDTATSRGAKTLRGAIVTAVNPGAEPSVSFIHNDVEHTVRCRLIVGADGHLNGSQRRRHHPAPGQAAPLVRGHAGRWRHRLGPGRAGDRHRGRLRLPRLPAG